MGVENSTLVNGGDQKLTRSFICQKNETKSHQTYFWKEIWIL